MDKWNTVKIHFIQIIFLLSVSQYSSAHGEKWWESAQKHEIPPPEVTYSPEDSLLDYPIAPSGEVYLPPSEERVILHEQNHDYDPIVTAILPPIYEVPTMDSVEDFVLNKEDLVVVNPAPDEYLWIMEGKRHGYNNLAIVLTNTKTGNGAPLHTHVGEESHVLLKGKMHYVLGNEEFTVEAPYIINIPSMVPHAFMNINDEVAELVGIFPESNHWEYDILDAQVFPESENIETKNKHRHPVQQRDMHNRYGNYDHEYWVDDWYSSDKRTRRINAYRRNQVDE